MSLSIEENLMVNYKEYNKDYGIIKRSLIYGYTSDYEENYLEVKKATEKFTEAIRNYVPTNEDQYGGFRIGPAYPFWSGDLDGLPSSIPGQGKKPDRPHAPFGNDIYFGKYTLDSEARNSLPGVRIFDELKSVETVEFELVGVEVTQNKNAEKRAFDILMHAQCEYAAKAKLWEHFNERDLRFLRNYNQELVPLVSAVRECGKIYPKQ
jgi:hypothetical protein